MFNRSLRALVVDDIAENRDVLAAMLETLGCTVHACDSGRDAIAYLDSHIMDVAFIDILMPGMDGIGLARRIRETDTTMPLFAVTASALHHDRDSIMAAGFGELLSKPVHIQELADCLEGRCNVAVREAAEAEICEPLSISEELCANLKSAAATCCTTDLKRLITLIPATTPAARRLVRDLQQAIVTFNYPGIQMLLGSLNASQFAGQS